MDRDLEYLIHSSLQIVALKKANKTRANNDLVLNY